jgi:CDP-glucose 4,6-dehydratase
VRPWQFVLEPLRGYLMVGRALVEQGAAFAEAWNFGPQFHEAVPVRGVARRITELWDRVQVELVDHVDGVYEARYLTLDSSKAQAGLGWEPLLTLDETLELTVGWYRAFHEHPDRAPELVRDQLNHYERRMVGAGWA